MMASAPLAPAHSAASGATLPRIGLPPMPAVARVLGRFSGHHLACFIEVAIELLDLCEADPDLEDSNDREACDGDSGDQAYVEWHTMRGAQKAGHNLLAGQEDDEDDDPAEEDDHGGCEHDGREPDDDGL